MPSAAAIWMRGFAIRLGSRKSVIGRPVCCNVVRTWLTVAPGVACCRIAHAPATCGAAMEVPSSTSKPPPGTEELIDEPGANRDRKDATLENDEIASLFVVEPTLTAEDTQAGNASASVFPSLPDATTVEMPTDRRLLICAVICGSSSSQVEVKAPPPRLRLAAAIAY